MAVIYNNENFLEYPKTAIALGTFDGLHIAHMKIIDNAVEYGKKHNVPYGVMLFDSIPANSFSKNYTKRLMKPTDRNLLLSYLDYIYIQEFDKSFYDKSPEEFVFYLKNILKAEFVSVGYNYKFGKAASGDAELLKELCAKEGITVSISEKMVHLGHTVSSTKIRELVSSGDVETASGLLGRNFFLSGRVINGYRNGHKLGFPTANLKTDLTVVLPGSGVYAGICKVDGKAYKSVVNVGDNPTFAGNSITVECHLLGFDDELYGKEIKVEFVKYIRKEIKFSTSSELAEQIALDIQYTERELINYE